jgi:Mg2+ and Co2+ transporter CorA
MPPTFITKDYGTFKYFEYRGLDDVLRDKLLSEFRIHEEDVDDVFSPTQLSKFETRKTYLYFALQFPSIRPDTNRIQVQQIHVFVSKKFLFVIDEDGLTSIKDFYRVRNKLVTHEQYNSFDLFYELLDISVISMFQILETLHARVREVEETLFSEELHESDHISEIQNIKKAIINFKYIISPLYELLEEILRKNIALIDEVSREALDDSLDKIKKLTNRLDNFRETMKLLTETNEMLIARSTDNNIRRLTLINILLL